MNLGLAVQYFREHEGVVHHMYLDVIGLVTIGVGFMLADEYMAAELPLVWSGSHKPATDLDKRNEWARLRTLAQEQQWRRRYASYFSKFTTLEMPDAYVDSHLRVLLTRFTTGLLQQFPELNSYPEGVQLGLLDMAYSMGIGGLKRYTMFNAAIRRGDWEGAARESARRNVSARRNKTLAALIRGQRLT